MSEATKEKLKQAKSKRGSAPQHVLDGIKESKRIQDAILKALGNDAKSIPEIAESTGIPTRDVFWHVNALRKYNKLHDVKKQGDYFTYAKK
jgi:soluble P-type ATPase